MHLITFGFNYDCPTKYERKYTLGHGLYAMHGTITLIGLLRKSTLLTEHAHDHVPWAPAGWCLMRTWKSSNIPTRKSLLSSYVSWGVKGKLACDAEFTICHIPHTLSASGKRYHWWDIHQGHTYWDAKGPNAQFSMRNKCAGQIGKTSFQSRMI